MLHNVKYNWCLLLMTMCLLTACQQASKEDKKDDNPPTTALSIPTFNADSAFAFVEKQVSFGPRVVNTEAHVNCGDWLAGKFREFGANVIEQRAELTAYTGETLNARNIIASYAPDKKRRVLLCAHWDSRHVADYDPDVSKRENPILGADDGGSGVAVLLEIARQLQDNPMDYMGVDLILFDAEDHGQPSDGGGFPQMQDSWCLGSQYWGKNPHVNGYNANFGILLDMVGSKNARFTKDGTSSRITTALGFLPDLLYDVIGKSS
ncbi:MAG: M28 family peptidase, partial [Bacteroidota bacterium]